jgi:hypothetical protein
VKVQLRSWVNSNKRGKISWGISGISAETQWTKAFLHYLCVVCVVLVRAKNYLSLYWSTTVLRTSWWLYDAVIKKNEETRTLAIKKGERDAVPSVLHFSLWEPISPNNGLLEIMLNLISFRLIFIVQDCWVIAIHPGVHRSARPLIRFVATRLQFSSVP